MNELFISYISILYALMCFLLREILYSNKKFKKTCVKGNLSLFVQLLDGGNY